MHSERSDVDLESSDGYSREERIRLALLEALVPTASKRKQLELGELWAIVWAHKLLVGVVTAAFACASVALALYLPNQYTATAILEPAHDTGGGGSAGGLEKLAGAVGSIAGLGGLGLGNSAEEERPEEAMSLLTNEKFLEDFVRKYNLEVPVVAAKGWDPKSNRLIIDPRLYNVTEHRWVGRFKTPWGVSPEPTGEDLYLALQHRITVTEDKNSDLFTLTVKYYSPYMAKQWADDLIFELNRVFEMQDRQQATKSMTYIQDLLSHTDVDDVRQFLYAMLEDQTQKLMLTKVSNGYVFSALMPPGVPDKKSGPKRALIVALGTVFGTGVAAVVAAMVDRRRRSAKSAATEPSRARERAL